MTQALELLVILHHRRGLRHGRHHPRAVGERDIFLREKAGLRPISYLWSKMVVLGPSSA